MIRIIEGDALTSLREMGGRQVHCCVTSPPYWGLRDYGVEGQLGLESTPEEYTAKLVEIFREVRRVLRDDGTLWLNLGDSYAGSGRGPQGLTGEMSGRELTRHRPGNPDKNRGASNRDGLGSVSGLKPKDLVAIPWRVAFALQADGWWLRSDIIWAKPNPMPESVTDRPTKSHEYLFLLAKSERYYFDADAVREPMAPESAARYDYRFGGKKSEALTEAEANGAGSCTHPIGDRAPTNGRNIRSVWNIPTQPFPGAHFAVFPPKLIEPCIKAGAPTGSVVLDPFGGAGTTGLVADRLGRDAILIEINTEYAAMARHRIFDDAPLFAKVSG